MSGQKRIVISEMTAEDKGKTKGEEYKKELYSQFDDEEYKDEGSSGKIESEEIKTGKEE